MQSVENIDHLHNYVNNCNYEPKNAIMRSQLPQQNSQIILRQIQRIKNFTQRIKGLQSQVSNNKKECQRTIIELKNQLDCQNRKISDYQLLANRLSVEESLKIQIRRKQTQYIDLCKKRIRIANQINVKTLRRIEIQDKESLANDIFKWVLVCLYCESDNKYFWPNFKEQALVNDKGQDFIERLGKFNSIITKEEHKVKTQKLIERYAQIIGSPQLHNSESDINKIHSIVTLFKNLYTLNDQIKQKQRLIQKHKQLTLEKDQQSMKCRARSLALSDRILINERYLRLLNQIERKIILKQSLYEQQVQNGERLKNDLFSRTNKENSGQFTNLIKPSEYLDQKKNDCQCRIF